MRIARALGAIAVLLVLWAPAPAVATGWMTLETPHLRVHFRPGYETAAMDAAAAGEDAVEALRQRLGSVPDRPVHVALVDDTDLANGYTDVTYYGRIIILPVFPVGLGYTTGLSLRMADWIRLVVTHEMVHAVHLDMAEGAARGLRQVFGHVPGFSTPNLLQPMAFIEGIATFEETELVTGGRGGDPLFDMFLRTAVLESKWPRMDEALGQYDLGYFQPAGHVYLYGYAWWDYVARRWGEDAIEEFQQEFASSGVTRPGEAVRRAFGESMEAIWKDLEKEAGERFAAQIEAIRRAGLTEPRLLPGSGAWVALSPRPSPDGRWVAYAASGPYLQDLRMVEWATGQDLQLAVGLVSAPGGIAWAPDGRYLYYAAVDEAGEGFFSDIYRIEPGSGRRQRITSGQRAWAPVAGPGGQLAFLAREGLETAVWWTGAPGVEPPRKVWKPPEGWQLLHLAWSPDGKRLALSAWKPGGGSDVLILPVEQERLGDPPRIGQAQSVTDDVAVDDHPSWSPDGRYLLFHSDRDGVYNLYACDTRTGRLARLTNVLTGAFDPAVSPDGQTVFFSWFGQGGYRLARLDWQALRWDPVTGDSRSREPDSPGGSRSPGSTEWKVRPYDPLESLRPAYWEPVWGQDWGGLYLGAGTSGEDALGAHRFAAAGAIGLMSGAPALYAAYAWQPGGSGPGYLSVEGGVEPVPVEEDGSGDVVRWQQMATARATVGWQRQGYAAGTAASLSLAQSWWREAYPSGEPWPAAERRTYAELWVARGGNWGDHVHLGSQQGWAQAVVLAEAGGRSVGVPEGLQVTGGWSLGLQRIDGQAVLAGLSAGVSGGHDLVTLDVGGESGAFPARGFDRATYQADAAAVGLQVEYRRRLVAIRQGMADAPTFFDDLSLALFAEGVAGWDRGGGAADTARPLSLEAAPWTPATDVGAELRLSVSLDYGRTPLVVRLGLARSLTPVAGLRWYLSLQAR
ncbi:hypothetical protein U7230_12905 [Carboxydochorda subterranea]|uniref:WD40 repeat protein n=1 Tax=Carboxydichorda subterranea TaxID=3109565 RepID=A0ABZ1BWD0_9FIRM|nr:hypothetical protein [Limnochorda sp. L945t]WRP16973.1 hypothetical protein U7230_12905 [Limnochorda sp. L945t]